MSVPVTSGSDVVVLWKAALFDEQATGLPALPCVASTPPVEMRRTSK